MWTVEVTAAFRYSCTRRPVQVTLLRSWIGTYTQRSEPSILLDGSWGPRNVIAVRSNYSIVHTRGHTHPSLISMATKECFEGISWDGSPTGKVQQQSSNMVLVLADQIDECDYLSVLNRKLRLLGLMPTSISRRAAQWSRLFYWFRISLDGKQTMLGCMSIS